MSTSLLLFESGHGCDRATRLLDVGLDFCCERSVAVTAGSAKSALPDRTPRAAGLGGVEVVRRWCRLPRRSSWRDPKQGPIHAPGLQDSSSQTRRRVRHEHRAQADGYPNTIASLAY